MYDHPVSIQGKQSLVYISIINSNSPYSHDSRRVVSFLLQVWDGEPREYYLDIFRYHPYQKTTKTYSDWPE